MEFRYTKDYLKLIVCLMFRIPSDFSDQIEKAVAKAEAKTHAEIVVVLAHRSATYWASALVAGMTLVYLFLLVALFSHFEIGPIVLAIELPILALFVSLGVLQSPTLIRLITSNARQHRRVQSAAHAAFYEESVGGTRARTGILVYISILEARVSVVADDGIKSIIPTGELEAISWSESALNPHTLGQMKDVQNGILELGVLCARHLPNDGPYDNEIPNQPVVRPW